MQSTDWSDQATWTPPSPPVGADPAASDPSAQPPPPPVAPAPMPMPAPAAPLSPAPSSFSVGLAVVLVGAGAAAGYALGGGWGAGAGALFIGAARNGWRARRDWSTDPGGAAKAASFAAVGAALGGYLVYRAVGASRGRPRRVSALE